MNSCAGKSKMFLQNLILFFG